MNAIMSSQAISFINAELKTEVLETGSADIIRVSPDDGDRTILQNISSLLKNDVADRFRKLYNTVPTIFCK
jgi:hypothetical protein